MQAAFSLLYFPDLESNRCITSNRLDFLENQGFKLTRSIDQMMINCTIQYLVLLIFLYCQKNWLYHFCGVFDFNTKNIKANLQYTV